MGTNFYLLSKPPCPTCGRGYEDKHIGKSSGGWCFSLHVYPEEGIHDLDDWQRLWDAPGAVIQDEYNRVISKADLLERITNRSARPGAWNNPEVLEENEAEQGPNNLARSRLGERCIKHGAGTWDCIVGDFS